MVRFAGYARKREPKWPYAALTLITLIVVILVIFIFSLIAQWLESEANKPVATTSTTTTISTTTISQATTTASLAPGKSKNSIKIVQIVITSGLDESNLPVDDLSKVSAKELSQIYCFTKIVNDGEPQAIKHVWVGPSGQVAAEIELTARGGTSSTWSYINITGARTGQWQLRVESKDGAVLAKRVFETF
ncbi:MAG: DUF2914 domain-containing protein [Sedimentisphaerales bacterium]